jgi:hypothetical protein
MEEIKTNPNVVNLASMPGLKDTVTTLLDQLDRCQVGACFSGRCCRLSTTFTHPLCCCLSVNRKR